MNLKFCLFLGFSATIDHFCNNANLNYPNAIEPTLLPNVISSLIAYFFWVVHFERFVRKLFHTLLEILLNSRLMNQKRKNSKKLSGKFIKFTKIDGPQGLFGLNLFVLGMGRWYGEGYGLFQD